MKKLRIHILLFLTLVTVSLASRSKPRLRSNRILSGTRPRNKFITLKAYYNPSAKECWFRYKVTNCPRTTVTFKASQIDQDGDTVTCVKKNCVPKSSSGLRLPVPKTSIKLKDAKWKSEVTRDAYVEWTKDKKLTVTMKKFTDWEAFYDSKKDKCTLEYKWRSDGTTTKIDFSDIDEDGEEVTCKEKDIDENDLPKDKGLVKFKYTIDSKDVEWVDQVVKKDALVTWEKGDPMVLTMKREPKPTDRDDFESLSLTYRESDDEVTFRYTIEDGDSGKVEFEDDEVDRDGDDVTFEKCAEPPDELSLPWKIVFKQKEVKVIQKCKCRKDMDCNCKPVKCDVDEAFFRWDEDEKCARQGPGRQLRRYARARGNIKLEGA